MVQSREALHRVDISVPETLRVIHKPRPSTYKKAGLELALSSTCLKALPSSTMLTHGSTWWGFFVSCCGIRSYGEGAGRLDLTPYVV